MRASGRTDGVRLDSPARIYRVARGVELDIGTSVGTMELRHHHAGWEVLLVHRGVAVVGGDGWRHVLVPGEAVVFHAGKLHGARPVHGRYVRTAFHFLPESVGPELNRLLMRHCSDKPALLAFHDSRVLLGIEQKPPDRIANFLVDELQERLLRREPGATPYPATLPSPLGGVLRYLVEGVGHKETIRDVAKRFFVSEGHLRRMFLQYLGCPLQRFWLYVKVEHACDLLLRDMSADEVSEATGFQSRSGFIRAFRRVTGMSPSSYLSRVREGFNAPKPFQRLASSE